jgi:predicted metal-dependent HD superfamily phosphohydrolase
MFTQARLNNALAAIGAAPSLALFDQLKNLYNEPSRFYHSQTHVEECLKALDDHRDLAKNPTEIEVAIWFHDAIYNSHKSDNEEQSAALAVTTLSSLGVASNCVINIEAMILATKSHIAHDPDTELLLDIDLAILGQASDVFNAYDEAIRKEYSWVAKAHYRQARVSILKNFLDRSKIYQTNRFYELYEAQARRNLSMQIDRLSET